jgi:hypothetical protein
MQMAPRDRGRSSQVMVHWFYHKTQLKTALMSQTSTLQPAQHMDFVRTILLHTLPGQHPLSPTCTVVLRGSHASKELT